MSQRIFDQLDRLERGARIETHTGRDGHHDSSADFSAYDGVNHDYAWHDPYYGKRGGEHDEFVEQPLTLDSFDEQLLRQPDYDSRQEQALRGQARMTLPPASNYQDYLPAVVGMRPSASQLPSLSQFAFDSASHGELSSSPFNRPLRSSPAFHASQRHPAPLGSSRLERPSLRTGPSTNYEQPSQYQPITAQDIDAEIEEYGDENAEPVLQQTARVPTHGRTQPPVKTTPGNIVPPIVQGIELVPTATLPDRFRALFPYPLFNAVQSKCFSTLYKTNDNFVLSSPTGSGKTAALELAICRLINGFAIGSYKIVYQAPTKSLCSERYRDWQAKFGPLDLQCVELTGDTDSFTQRNVQNATIIVTTPEKWDSVTRKWKDQQKLMRMVKLFLIDEVHILKEDRGATLEAVVSRMKSVGSNVRFIGLSATVPNSEDIATWLGKNPMNPALPAQRERFGEEFRPVRLQKHVVGYRFDGNDFAFDKTLSGKLPDVITKYSQRKPIMVFCFTRPSCVETARTLSNWWATKEPRERYWSQPRTRIVVGDKDLSHTIASGVAFHHAGLSIQDRTAVEQGYLSGQINVICCTSTLAVGVNLPCHMVIIKNTVSYQSTGCKEYSDLETMQMLGRAGRPQFDDSAVAVIMSKTQRVPYYEKMITGQEVLESCLHRNLIDHLNAEIGLGTITNASSAKKWLSGTFLYVRLKADPEHYKLDGDPTTRNLDERLENICERGLALLEEHELISMVPKLHCTEFGDAMARYYLQFDTMKVFLALPPKAKVSEILSAISQASEFKDVRFRAGDRTAYKDLNKNASIKYPLPGTVSTPAHKISLIIQSVLGGIEFPSEDYKLRMEYAASKGIVFNNVSRLVRCIIDCQLVLEDAVAARNALALARSLGAQLWDDSPLHIQQLESVGPVTVRKLVGAGIRSMEDLENTEAHRIEHALSRNPPFGAQLLDKTKAFPKLRVSVQMVGEPVVKKGEHVLIKLRAELGFLNDKAPITFQRKQVYVCLLAETSDGRVIHFARIGAKKLDKGQDVLFSTNLTSASQSIRAYVMCDEIAGTARHASLKPDIPADAFPPPKTAGDMKVQRGSLVHAPSTSKRRTSANNASRANDDESDEFGDAGLDDADFAQAEADVFVDIDEFENAQLEPPKKKQKTSTSTQANADWQPTQLSNGKWACNHTCKDKTQCKHLCCRDGVDKPPKPPKAAQEKKTEDARSDPRQTQLDVSISKKPNAPVPTAVTTSIEKSAPTQSDRKTEDTEVRDLDHLHNGTQSKTPKVPILGQGKTGKKPLGRQAPLSFLVPAPGRTRNGVDIESTDYGDESLESADLASDKDFVVTQPPTRMDSLIGLGSSNDDEEMLDNGYDLGADNQTCRPLEHSRTLPATQIALTKTKASETEARLFVGHSTDSAARDLGLSQSQSQVQTLDAADQCQRSSRFFPASKQMPKRTASPSAALREEAERFEIALPLENFAAEIDDIVAGRAEVEEESTRESSPDSLKRWVMEEFGTEMFNLTW